MTADTVIALLEAKLNASNADWKSALLEAIALWPLPDEDFQGERLEYLIGGEAFDWRLLAARLARSVAGLIVPEAVAEWIEDPDPTAGLAEAEFGRLLGVEKHRSHLSFVYGVLVERALVAAVEQEITKRVVAAGAMATERARDEAFERLYLAQHESLWAEFRKEPGNELRGKHGARKDHVSLGDMDAFTYWLFKRRLSKSDPARVASDTRKGVNQLERMRKAHDRRTRSRRAERAFDQIAQDAVAQAPGAPGNRVGRAKSGTSTEAEAETEYG